MPGFAITAVDVSAQQLVAIEDLDVPIHDPGAPPPAQNVSADVISARATRRLNSDFGGGRGIRAPEGLHPSGF